MKVTLTFKPKEENEYTLQDYMDIHMFNKFKVRPSEPTVRSSLGEVTMVYALDNPILDLFKAEIVKFFEVFQLKKYKCEETKDIPS